MTKVRSGIRYFVIAGNAVFVLWIIRNGMEAGFRGRPVEVTILYELDPTHHGTRVKECFEIRNHGIPWFFALLAGWIHRTGKPQGPSALEQLCELLQPEVASEQLVER